MKERGPLIYVVDDDASVRRAVSLLLRAHGYSVESFPCAEDFLSFKHPKVPSCLVLDIKLPDIDGLALQEAMTARQLSIPIVFITGHGDVPMSVKGMKAGAVDFLQKPFTAKKLLEAVTIAVSKNKIQNKESAEIAALRRRLKTLTPRELEVFRLVAQGMLSKQIAYKRGTSLQTIKVHRGRVMQKMQAKTVTELIHFAQKTGVTPPKS